MRHHYNALWKQTSVISTLVLSRVYSCPCLKYLLFPSVVWAQVWVGAGMSGHSWTWIDRAVGWVPVSWWGGKEIARGYRHWWRVATHEVHFGLVAVVGLKIRHICLVLYNPSFHCVILMCLRDALEVKLVSVALAVHLCHDVLVIVVAQSTA